MSLPYDHYPAVLDAIEMMGQGRTLTEACDRANIAVPTFRKYVAADKELAEMFEEAEQRSYDAMADALINIDNHKIHGQSDARMAKVVSDNIKWVLGKRDNKRFGDRLEVKHEITMDRAITDALNRARDRAQPLISAPDVIDAEVLPADWDEEDVETMRELLS